MRYYTDDPVADFECYDRDQWRRAERQYIGECPVCREPIYEWEEPCNIDGEYVHQECEQCYLEDIEGSEVE